MEEVTPWGLFHANSPRIIFRVMDFLRKKNHVKLLPNSLDLAKPYSCVPDSYKLLQFGPRS